jgi:hypothetical protein
MVLKRRGKVCVLSAFDGEEFKRTKQATPCRLHKHFSYDTASVLASGPNPEIEWLGDSIAMWHEVRIWKVRPSGGAQVLQLVRPQGSFFCHRSEETFPRRRL